MIESIMKALSGTGDPADERRAIAAAAAALPQLTDEQTDQLLENLTDYARRAEAEIWPDRLLTLFGPVAAPGGKPWPAEGDHRLVEIYRSCPADHVLRNHLLFMIGRGGSPVALCHWATLLIDDPPQSGALLELAFAPIMAENATLDDALLSRLLNGATGHPNVAAAVYDACNHAVRTGKVKEHPARHRMADIRTLLGTLVARLSEIEEGQFPSDASPQSIASTISNAVALVVALIDTVALLEDQASIGKLHQALQLRHRRIQVEAAAALARLGDESGRQMLIAAAAQPVVRQRVIKYSRELGIEDQISLEHQGPIATAESCLAMWLAEPAQMGMAPSRLELVDERQLYWPSYEDPVSCFLFRFEYGSDDQAYANIGIHGPLTHAFAADLTVLSTSDMYAVFAGWQTVSDEIFMIPPDRARQVAAADYDLCQTQLDHADFELEELETAVSFFGSRLLVARGTRDGVPGTLIVTTEESVFIGAGNPDHPIDARLALDLWIGRNLLTRFNPTFAA